MDVFSAESHSWWVTPGWGDYVRAEIAPMASEPEALPGARIIKSNRVRTVAHVPGSGGREALYVKRFRAVKSNAPLAWRFKGTPARREWDALRRFRSAGLDCPEPVILGEARDSWGLPQAAVLATKEIAGCEEISVAVDRLRAAGDLGGSERLTHDLARIAWTIFQAGGNHPDMHLGNFLVRPDGGVVTLDLHSVRLSDRPVPAWLRRRRLGKLAHSFGPHLSPSGVQEVTWFAWAYAGFDHALGPAPALANWLLERAARVEAIRLKSRDKRCLVHSTLFTNDRIRGARIYRRRECSREAVQEAAAATPAATVHVHPFLRSRLELIPCPKGLGDSPQVLRKSYAFQGLGKRLGAAFLETAPMRTWKAARACEVREIPTANVYALLLDTGVLPAKGVVFMEWIEGARMLHHLSRADPPLPPASRRRLARDLGALMGRFHRLGLKHSDLAGQNVLCRPEADGCDGRRGWKLWIVDLDDVLVGAMTRAETLRALVHLGDQPMATRSDRLRFFRAYLNAGGREVLGSELALYGVRQLGQLVGSGILARARARTTRRANRDGPPRPPSLDAL